MAPSLRKQHVVAVPLPAQGHLNSLMRFCQVLASHGFLVTFVNIDPVHHRIEEVMNQQQHVLHDSGEAKPSGAHASNISFAHVPVHGLDLTRDFRVSLELFCEALNSIGTHLELLIAKLNGEGPPVTCIVSDIFMTTPTQNVADKLNLPRIALFPSSASLLLLNYYVIQGEHTSVTKVLEALARKAEKREVIWEGLIGLPTIYNNEVPHYKHVVDDTLYLWELVVNICRESFYCARAMVINSFEDLEAPAFMALSSHLSLPVYGVGPLVEPLQKETSTSLWKEDEACLLWLDQQPPLSVLYISFGSVTLLSKPQLEEMVAGLLSSQQCFLWVFRPDLVDVENVDNSSTFIQDVLSRCHGKGYFVDWAPQPRVLAHSSVGGFLTHCGWNSTLEAIVHGVPMLCWPYFGDQLLNAKFVVEEWKVGLQFEASTKGDASLIERGEVERVIKALMQGEEGRALRKNTIGLKEVSYQSLQVGGSSHTNIQALIKACMWE